MTEQENNSGKMRFAKGRQCKRTKKETIRLTIILVLIVLFAAFIVAFAKYRAWAKAPDLPSGNPPSQPGQTEQDPEGEAEGVESPGERKKDFYTFLVVGRDTGGGGNTDTIILVAYDIPHQKLNVMSIPRDTMVNIPYDIKRINAVYNYYGGGEKGIEALYKEVSQLVGFVPDYKVVVEWDAIGDLVEAMDGVWFDVPHNMDYDDPTQDLHIHVEKGYQLLSGEDAMGVIRWRMNNDGTGYATGDIGRIETQQAFLKAVVAQCLRIENVAKIREFAQVFSDNVHTDLTVGNLVWFAEQAVFGGMTMESVNFITMPGNYYAQAWSRVYHCMQSYVLPDGKQMLSVVNQSFNPYLQDREPSGLDIMSVNQDGSLSSSTGYVEDKKATLPPILPKPELESETPQETDPVPTPTVTPEPEATPESEENGIPENEVPETSESTPEQADETDDVPDPVSTPGKSEPETEQVTPSGEIPTLPPIRAAA